MGQRGSHSPKPNFSNSFVRRSFHKKPSFRNKDLSATFNIIDINMRKSNLLNINLAAEEELMTLPGITRTIARNIVDYRLAIGGFKRVEDIALVSGIGASKLEQIRDEITTTSRYPFLRKNDSSSCQTSLSEEQSLDSFFSGESGSCSKRFFKMINVNTSNVFQLMSIQGISQELAANIVDYRDRKGPFKNLEQLLKVKGMNYRIFGAIRLYLTVDSSNDIENDSGVLDMKPTGSETETYDNVMNNVNKSRCHRRSKSAPMKYQTYKDDNASSDILVLLSNRSKRPILQPSFDFTYNDRKAIRFAAWNLEGLTEAKADNSGTKEVICRTILENGFGIVLFQDIFSLSGFNLIIDELNKPTLPWVKQWPGHRGIWKISQLQNASDNTSFSVFIYDSSQQIEHISFTQNVSCSSIMCSIAKFKIRELNVTFVATEDDDDEKTDEALHKPDKNCDNNTFIISKSSSQSNMDSKQLSNICCNGISSHVNNRANNTSHIHFYAADTSQMQLCTGRNGAVTEGLSHMAIPKGWKWGGVVTSSFPSWIEIYVD